LKDSSRGGGAARALTRQCGVELEEGLLGGIVGDHQGDVSLADVNTRLAVALALLMIVGCGKQTEPEQATGEVGPSEPNEPSKTTPPAEVNGVPPETPQPQPAGPLVLLDPLAPEPEPSVQPTVEHVRASTLATVGISVQSSIDLDFPELDRLRALEASVAIPSWAQAITRPPSSARDDELRTSWSCMPGEDRPCAWLASFATTSKLKAIRVVPGAYGHASAKLEQVRVHTDAGVFEVAGFTADKPAYLVFGAAIETRSVVLELIAPKASERRPIRLAEVELLGVDGPARPSLDLDPEAAYVSWPGDAALERDSNEGGWARLASDVCLHLPSAGREPCFSRATAAYGVRGDRALLLESIHKTDCTKTVGVWLLVDQHTRRVIKLDGVPGPTAAVYRHRLGLGFAFHAGEDGKFTAIRIASETGAIVRESLPTMHALEAAGFENRYTPRGGAGNQQHVGRQCRRPEAEFVTGLRNALAAESELLAELARIETGELLAVVCSEPSGDELLIGERAYRLRGQAIVDSAPLGPAIVRGLGRSTTGEILFAQLDEANQTIALHRLADNALTKVRSSASPAVELGFACAGVEGAVDLEVAGPLPGDVLESEEEGEDDFDEEEDEEEGDDEDESEDWVARPSDSLKRITGIPEIDASIHDYQGGGVCFSDSESGDLDGVGPKDWIARFITCEIGEPYGSMVFLVGPGNTVVDLSPPSVGGYGGWPKFDRMRDGERVLLLEDSCCEIEAYGIVHLRNGQLVLGDSVDGTNVEVVRDGSGRIIKLVEHKSNEDE
jgi:hypothetical protein